MIIGELEETNQQIPRPMNPPEMRASRIRAADTMIHTSPTDLALKTLTVHIIMMMMIGAHAEATTIPRVTTSRESLCTDLAAITALGTVADRRICRSKRPRPRRVLLRRAPSRRSPPPRASSLVATTPGRTSSPRWIGTTLTTATTPLASARALT